MSDQNQTDDSEIDYKIESQIKEINRYVDHKIKQSFDGFELNENGEEFKYLLKKQFADLDGSYRSLYTEGVDCTGPLPFDYHFDKSKSDNRKDVFDELVPLMLAEENCRAKILFPFNMVYNLWLTGELVLEKKGNLVSVLVYAHDPYGKGTFSNEKFKVLEDRLKTAFGQLDVQVTSQISPFTSNRISVVDACSSGVVVADEVVKRITGESLTLSTNYPVGVRQLHACQTRFLKEACNDELPKIEENEKAVLSIHEVRDLFYQTRDSKIPEEEKSMKLQDLVVDYYKPLVTQLANPMSIEEMADLVIVFNDLMSVSLTLSDLTNQVDHLIEAAVTCQYIKTILKEKFSSEQRDKFSERYSVHPSERWNEIQAKLVPKLGGNLDLLQNMTQEAAGYKKLVKNMRYEARLEIDSIDMRLKDFKTANPKNNRDKHRHVIFKPVQDLSKNIAEKMRTLLAKCYSDSERIMATSTPCRYAVIGLGALALQQMTPFTKFQFAILTDLDAHKNPEIMAYFQNLTRLVLFKVLSLGESGKLFENVQVCSDQLIHFGIRFDSDGNTPLEGHDKLYNLIQNVPEMLNYVCNGDNKHLGRVLETVCYVTGHKGLVEQYQKQVSTFLKQTNYNDHQNCQVRAYKTLKEDVAVFNYANKQSYLKPEEIKFDRNSRKMKILTFVQIKYYKVKQEICRLAEDVVRNLGLYFGIEGDSCWDILDKMKGAGIINEGGHKNLCYAVSFANFLRLKTSFNSNSPDTNNEIEALEENGELFSYFYTVFPLFEKLEEFCSNHAGEFSYSEKVTFFQNESFLKIDSLTKGLVSFRLNHCEDALRHLANALETSKPESRWKISAVMVMVNMEIGHTPIAMKIYESIDDEAFMCSKSGISFLRKLGIFLSSYELYDLAIDVFKRILRYHNNKNSRNPEIAKILNLIGDAYKLNSDINAAKEYFQKSLDTTNIICRGSPNLDLAEALIKIADVHRVEGELKLAINAYEEGLKIQITISKGTPNLDVACTLVEITDLYLEQTDFGLALKYFEQYLQIHKANTQDLTTAEIANHLGKIVVFHQKNGNYDLALRYAHDNLDMSKAYYKDTDHPEVANSLEGVSLIHFSRGEHDLALKYGKESLDRKKAFFKNSTHLGIALMLKNIGNIYHAKGQFDLALKYFKNSLDVHKAFYKNLAHPNIANALDYIGVVYHSIGEFDTALKYCEDSLDIKKAYYKVLFHPDIAETVRNIGGIHFSKDQIVEAINNFELSLELVKAYYKDMDHPSIADCLEYVAMGYQEKVEFNIAFKYYKDCLAMRKSIYKSAHPKIAMSLNKIGALYQLIGENDLALQYHKECLKVRRSVYKFTDHLEVATSLSDIGDVYRKKCEYESALKYFKKCLAMQKSIYKFTDHQSVAQTLSRIGKIFQEIGAYDLALEFFKECLQMRNAIVSDHEKVMSSLKNIGDVYQAKGENDLAREYHKKYSEMRKKLCRDVVHRFFAS